VVLNAVKEDAEQPGAAIGAGFEAVEGFPRLQVRFLDGVFGAGAVCRHAVSQPEHVGEMWHGFGFEGLPPGVFRRRGAHRCGPERYSEGKARERDPILSLHVANV